LVSAAIPVHKARNLSFLCRSRSRPIHHISQQPLLGRYRLRARWRNHAPRALVYHARSHGLLRLSGCRGPKQIDGGRRPDPPLSGRDLASKPVPRYLQDEDEWGL